MKTAHQIHGSMVEYSYCSVVHTRVEKRVVVNGNEEATDRLLKVSYNCTLNRTRDRSPYLVQDALDYCQWTWIGGVIGLLVSKVIEERKERTFKERRVSADWKFIFSPPPSLILTDSLFLLLFSLIFPSYPSAVIHCNDYHLFIF